MRETRTQRTVVAWKSARRAGAVEVNLADAADIIVRNIPSPGGHRCPLLDLDLHVHPQDVSMFVVMFNP